MGLHFDLIANHADIFQLGLQLDIQNNSGQKFWQMLEFIFGKGLMKSLSLILHSLLSLFISMCVKNELLPPHGDCFHIDF